MTETLVDQCLHGYREGHTLLESSLPIGRKDRRLMQMLSDRSGPSSKEFSTWLTGYPLEESGLYCLARTWEAPEMERSGCVWTHSLLIKPETFAQTTQVAQLTSLFARPGDGAKRSIYSNPARLPTNPLETSTKASFPTDVVAALIECFFAHADAPVVIGSLRGDFLEQGVLGVWWQIWPSLKHRLRFSTGALGSVRDFHSVFDLQIVPNERVRQVARETEGCMIVDIKQEAAPWAALSARDVAIILTDGSSPLSQFLASFAGESASRAEYRNLAELWPTVQKMDESATSFDPKGVIHLLAAIRGRNESLFAYLLRLAAPRFGSPDILELDAEAIPLLPALFRHNDALGEDPLFWIAYPEIQRDLVQVLLGFETANPKILSAILVSRMRVMMDEIVWKFGVHTVLDLLDQSPGDGASSVGTVWVDAIAANEMEIAHWFLENASRCRISSAAYVAKTLWPNSPASALIGSGPWVRFASPQTDELTEVAQMDLAAFLIATAFTFGGSDSIDLFASSFDLIHELLWHDKLSYSAWKKIEPYLPNLAWYEGWDRCERLRRGLALHLSRGRWDDGVLNRIYMTPFARERVSSYWRRNFR